jgi:acetolactate decarboxylase
MPKLNCEISETLMQALGERSRRTGEPVWHIVMSSLADTLDVAHATVFQVSTAGALVQGVYDGVVTVRELKRHGDFGLGTFDGLDGEMLTLDGRVYQVRSDGTIHESPNDAKVPFAVMTWFKPGAAVELTAFDGFDDLVVRLDRLRRTDNLFYAASIAGCFRRVHTRAACKVASGVSLVDATAHQAEFTFSDVEGTIAGFWSPPYARSVNVAGWHLHFLTNDHKGGGHVLDCAGPGAHARIEELDDLHIAIPEMAAFLKADLRDDPTGDLDKAERAGHRGGPPASSCNPANSGGATCTIW